MLQGHVWSCAYAYVHMHTCMYRHLFRHIYMLHYVTYNNARQTHTMHTHAQSHTHMYTHMQILRGKVQVMLAPEVRRRWQLQQRRLNGGGKAVQQESRCVCFVPIETVLNS